MVTTSNSWVSVLTRSYGTAIVGGTLEFPGQLIASLLSPEWLKQWCASLPAWVQFMACLVQSHLLQWGTWSWTACIWFWPKNQIYTEPTPASYNSLRLCRFIMTSMCYTATVVTWIISIYIYISGHILLGRRTMNINKAVIILTCFLFIFAMFYSYSLIGIFHTEVVNVELKIGKGFAISFYWGCMINKIKIIINSQFSDTNNTIYE